MCSLIIISTTFEEKADGLKIARTLLEERLVACTQLSGPISSCYHWQGEIASEEEFVLSMKTVPALYKKVEKRLMEIHPYEIPEIVSRDVTSVSREYLNWVEKEVSE